MKFNYKNKNIEIEVKKCSTFQMILGLMFTKRDSAKVLLFDFKKPVKTRIHSFFVFFPFFALYFDKKNKIIGLKRVRPFTFAVSIDKPFYKIVEIPINKKNKKIVELLVGD